MTDIPATLPWMEQEANLIRQAHARELPVLGTALAPSWLPMRWVEPWGSVLPRVWALTRSG